MVERENAKEWKSHFDQVASLLTNEDAHTEEDEQNLAEAIHEFMGAFNIQHSGINDAIPIPTHQKAALAVTYVQGIFDELMALRRVKKILGENPDQAHTWHSLDNRSGALFVPLRF